MADPKRRATYDDLRRVPEPLVAEIVDGVLYTSPRPAPPHGIAQGAIFLAVATATAHDRQNPCGGGPWRFIPEPELHFADDVLVPDVAGWRRERMPVVTDEAAIRLAPDWVCEVLSPSTRTLDRRRKMPVYAREGVPYLWLVDPLARVLETFRLEGDAYGVTATYGDTDRVRCPPFDDAAIDLAPWWEGTAR